MIEEWSAHGVSHGKFSARLHEETSVLECSHSVRPCLATRIYEATIDPACYFIYLQPHIFRAIFHVIVYGPILFFYASTSPSHARKTMCHLLHSHMNARDVNIILSVL